MTEEPPSVYSIARLATELEIALEEYRGASGDTPGARLLARAEEADDAYKKKGYSEEEKTRRLAETVAWARREGGVDDPELERLIGVVGTVSECSYENGYVLATILHAAATGRSGIEMRLRTSMVSGEAAVHVNQLEPARNAYADAIETLRLMARFFNLEGFFQVDADHLAETETFITRAWEGRDGQLGKPSRPLDLPERDAAGFLLEHVIWNTDFGQDDRGLLVQSDAFARLVIRLEHWSEIQGGDPQAIASAWEKAIDDNLSIPGLKPEDYPFARARCAIVCADALLETGNPGPAIPLYDQALRDFSNENHPLHVHARIDQALALYQLGLSDEARRVFAAIDRVNLQELAEFVLTVRSEWARYLAVARLLRFPLNDLPAEDVAKIVEHIARMLVGTSDGRTGYLRNLFIGELVRDIEALRFLAQ